MPTPLFPPLLSTTLSPLLTALANASATPKAPIGLLSHLTPILRQRIKYLSTPSSPWPCHLSQDPALIDTLNNLLAAGTLEVHPLSNLVEIDWEDLAIKVVYEKLDIETLHAWVSLAPLENLCVKLLWTTKFTDPEISSPTWKIDALFSPSHAIPPTTSITISVAERTFTSLQPATISHPPDEEEADNDDDYWTQYYATPAVPPSSSLNPTTITASIDINMSTAERDYFDMYSDVQPALDGHDPDEADGVVTASIHSTLTGDSFGITSRDVGICMNAIDGTASERSSIVNVDIAHPRPKFVVSSQGSEVVEKLETEMEKREVADIAIREHVGWCVKGLWLLAERSGMGREEFEGLIRSELGMLRK